jgi:multiple sugar transport system permease protein
VWKSVGYNMMILIVAIQAIPPELEEAARLDGAPAWTRFRRITLPMLSHALFFVIVVSLIAAFQNFEQTYVLTRGGPANATLTLSYYIYQNAFQFFRMGYASAMAYVLCALVIAVTWLQFRQQRRWVVED